MPLARRTTTALLAAAALTIVAPAARADADPAVVQPHTLVVDRSVPAARVDALVGAPLRYAAFWGTGDPALERAALDPNFVDRTLPPGRAQGVAGPLAASTTMRAAIPDLTCEVDQMIVAADRVVSHLHFRGTFTGVFDGRPGRGQAVDFIATDIYRVADDRIAENWHIEDNQTLMRQLAS